MASCKPKRKSKFSKVSELDYKILILENCEVLSENEQQRLESLKEQKAFQDTLGICIQKTVKVPIEWIAVDSSNDISVELNNASFPELDEEISEAETKSPIKQGFANAHIQFLKEKRKILNNVDKEAKVDMDEIRKEWKFLPESARKPYKKLAQEEKKKLGVNFRKDIKEQRSHLSSDELKKRKIESDRKYRLKVKLEKDKNLKDDEFCLNKFKKILEKKEEQVCELVEQKKALKVNVNKLKVDNSVTAEMIKDKDSEIDKLKDQYRTLYKVHKSCSLSK